MNVEYCRQCNGVTRIASPISEPMPATQGVFLLCPGHPVPKHNGELDEDVFVSIDKSPANGKPFVDIYRSSSDETLISLTGKQAMSLLEWLQQNKAMLESIQEEAKS